MLLNSSLFSYLVSMGENTLLKLRVRLSLSDSLLIFNKFLSEVEPKDMKVETEIARMETSASSSSGDYSSGHDYDDCSIRLVCKAPKSKTHQIKTGSCSFT